MDYLLLLTFLYTLLLHSCYFVNGRELILTPPNIPCKDRECMPFKECSVSPSQCFSSDTTVIFLAAEYPLRVPITIQEVQNLSLHGQSSESYSEIQQTATIHCDVEAGVSFINVTFLHIFNIHLNSCGFEINTSLLISKTKYHQHFLKNCYKAGLQLMLTSHTVLEHVVISNSTGNGIFWINPFDSYIKNSMITHTNYYRIAEQLQGLIDCTNQSSHCEGGNVWILFADVQCPSVDTDTTFFIQNTDISYGINLNNFLWGPRYAAGLGVTLCQTTFDVLVRIENSNIHDNVGDAGANAYFRIMNYVFNSSIELFHTSLSYGNRPFTDPQYMQYYDQATGVYIDIDSMEVLKVANASVKTCRGYPDSIHTKVTLNNVSMIDNRGGAMKIYIIDTGEGRAVPCCFDIHVSNTTIDGTEVYYYDPDVRTSLALFIQGERVECTTSLNVSLSNVQISNSYIVFNSASSDLDDFPKISTVFFYYVSSVYIYNSTIENNDATGLLTLSSTFHFIGHNTLRNNSGILGGAITMNDDSKMYLHPDSITKITENRASTYGGGVVVNWGLAKDYFAPCFYQLIPKDSAHILSSDARIIMRDNSAAIAGHSLYGGDYLICFQLHQNLVRVSPNDTFRETFRIMDDIRDSEISSVALGLCFCAESNPYACISPTMRHLHIYPGEEFTVEAIGLGYTGTTAPTIVSHQIENLDINGKALPNVTIVNSGPQTLETICRNLSYQLEAPENVTNIGVRLVAEGSVFPNSHSRLLNITSRFCPVGFQVTANRCGCQSILHHLAVDCIINNQSFYHRGSVWVNFTDNKVLYHKHCLPEYCKVSPVYFHASNADAQCANNHSGILCGGCKKGFSIALGSSKCLECTNTYLAFIPLFTLAGILLIIFLTTLNLTVATGTINGLIFYANIVQASQGSFGVTAYGSKIASIFIAWLNLDFGFETCFYNGLDIFAKTFLQFVFPVYIWVLVTVIIISSHYSTLMARLSGRNAVPVLATLFLLSYAKILRAIIISFSFTLIHREGDTIFVVWFYDGNVPFLDGKHLILFIVSLIFGIVFVIPLVLLILFAPCLQRMQHYRIVRVMTRLKPLLDSYQGPYKDGFRFWTGLMLVVQTILLIGCAMNASGDPGITLFVIILVNSLVLLVTLLGYGGVYKDNLLTGLQCFYVYNLVLFASWSLFNRYNVSETSLIKQQRVTIHTMIGMTALVFVITILCHIYSKLKRNAQISQILRRFLEKVKPKNEAPECDTNAPASDSEPRVVRPPTVSVVSICEPLLSEGN